MKERRPTWKTGPNAGRGEDRLTERRVSMMGGGGLGWRVGGWAIGKRGLGWGAVVGKVMMSGVGGLSGLKGGGQGGQVERGMVG